LADHYARARKALAYPNDADYVASLLLAHGFLLGAGLVGCAAALERAAKAAAVDEVVATIQRYLPKEPGAA